MSSEKQHPFIELSLLIDKYRDNKDSFDVKELQTMREEISLCLFYLSDSVSQAISNYDKTDWERKRSYAQLIEDHRFDEEGGKNTVAVMESLARLGNKEAEEKTAEALRMKERVRIIISATTNILHAISSRLNIIQK